MEKPALRSSLLEIQYGCRSSRWLNCIRLQEVMWLNTSNTYMMNGNWKSLQPVGDSDKFAKRVIGRCHVNTSYAAPTYVYERLCNTT